MEYYSINLCCYMLAFVSSELFTSNSMETLH